MSHESARVEGRVRLGDIVVYRKTGFFLRIKWRRSVNLRVSDNSESPESYEKLRLSQLGSAVVMSAGPHFSASCLGDSCTEIPMWKQVELGIALYITEYGVWNGYYNGRTYITSDVTLQSSSSSPSSSQTLSRSAFQIQRPCQYDQP